MKAKLTVLFSVFALAGAMVVYGTVLPGCDAAEELCGPCGKVALGDATITGNAELDGIFKAIGTLKLTTGAIKGDFDGRVRALAEGVFGIDVEGKATADLVAEIKASYNAMISANVDGDVSVNFQPPKCQASVDVAVSASAQCEAKLDANCSADVQCDPGKLSFECEGSCSGSCEGTCEVPSCEVAVSGPSLACEGTCSGGCAVDVNAKCEGKCEGTCDGECSAYVDNGGGEMDCAGTCSGKCEGKCEVKAEASCSGECRGSCKLTGPTATANCTGELKCEGKCEGKCSGGCTGEVKAPSCEGEVECNADASAKCEAQASAQASASMECTPPTLELDYNFKAGVNAQAQAEFLAKLDKFRVEMIAIIQGTAKLRALVDANYAAELGITPPTVAIGASVDAFLDALASGNIEFEAPGLAVCAIPAFEDSAQILADLPGEVAGTITAQLDLVALVVPAGK